MASEKTILLTQLNWMGEERGKIERENRGILEREALPSL